MHMVNKPKEYRLLVKYSSPALNLSLTQNQPVANQFSLKTFFKKWAPCPAQSFFSKTVLIVANYTNIKVSILGAPRWLSPVSL